MLGLLFTLSNRWTTHIITTRRQRCTAADLWLESLLLIQKLSHPSCQSGNSLQEPPAGSRTKAQAKTSAEIIQGDVGKPEDNEYRTEPQKKVFVIGQMLVKQCTKERSRKTSWWRAKNRNRFTLMDIKSITFKCDGLKENEEQWTQFSVRLSKYCRGTQFNKRILMRHKRLCVGKEPGENRGAWLLPQSSALNGITGRGWKLHPSFHTPPIMLHSHFLQIAVCPCPFFISYVSLILAALSAPFSPHSKSVASHLISAVDLKLFFLLPPC